MVSLCAHETYVEFDMVAGQSPLIVFGKLPERAVFNSGRDRDAGRRRWDKIPKRKPANRSDSKYRCENA